MVLVVVALAAIFYIDSLSSSTDKAVTKPAQEMPATPETKAAAPATAAGSDLPMLPLTRLDGSRFMAKDLTGKAVLVLFQPDCDHCQREATQIREHIEAFEAYSVYFISDAALPQLRQFAKTYNLADQSNVHFAHATINDILDQIGPIQAPSLFVFSEEGKLVKSFIGETPIEEILKVL